MNKNNICVFSFNIHIISDAILGNLWEIEDFYALSLVCKDFRAQILNYKLPTKIEIINYILYYDYSKTAQKDRCKLISGFIAALCESKLRKIINKTESYNLYYNLSEVICKFLYNGNYELIKQFVKKFNINSVCIDDYNRDQFLRTYGDYRVLVALNLLPEGYIHYTGYDHYIIVVGKDNFNHHCCVFKFYEQIRAIIYGYEGIIKMKYQEQFNSPTILKELPENKIIEIIERLIVNNAQYLAIDRNNYCRCCICGENKLYKKIFKLRAKSPIFNKTCNKILSEKQKKNNIEVLMRLTGPENYRLFGARKNI